MSYKDPKLINPPDLAIALEYDGEHAPKVTAKGQGEIAHRILDLAEAADVPMKHDAQLAAVLSQVPLEDEIPEPLYVAIAEVIAFAYVVAGKAPKGYQQEEAEPPGQEIEIVDVPDDELNLSGDIDL